MKVVKHIKPFKHNKPTISARMNTVQDEMYTKDMFIGVNDKTKQTACSLRISELIARNRQSYEELVIKTIKQAKSGGRSHPAV